MTPNKAKALKAARQAKGILDKVIAMIEDGEYCPEIIQQADATIGLVRACKRQLLQGHLNNCLAKRLKDEQDPTVKELMKIYNLSN